MRVEGEGVIDALAYSGQTPISIGKLVYEFDLLHLHNIRYHYGSIAIPQWPKAATSTTWRNHDTENILTGISNFDTTKPRLNYIKQVECFFNGDIHVQNTTELPNISIF